MIGRSGLNGCVEGINVGFVEVIHRNAERNALDRPVLDCASFLSFRAWKVP